LALEPRQDAGQERERRFGALGGRDESFDARTHPPRQEPPGQYGRDERSPDRLPQREGQGGDREDRDGDCGGALPRRRYERRGLAPALELRALDVAAHFGRYDEQLLAQVQALAQLRRRRLTLGDLRGVVRRLLQPVRQLRPS